MRLLLIILLLFSAAFLSAQESTDDQSGTYKKRVLESTEIDMLLNYYEQDGDNAAVTGGRGTEELKDISPSIIVAIPLNDDDVLTINGNISAYTSASSSNINPFMKGHIADPFVASSGASSRDGWVNLVAAYSHSSDDRNRVWTANASFSSEYDYISFGLGGGYTMLFNEKNTELSFHGNIFLDTWSLIYPAELSPSGDDEDDEDDWEMDDEDDFYSGSFEIAVPGYTPMFSELNDKNRNSYSLGFNLSQILSSRLNSMILAEVISQKGLLSTPFHRVYFSDKEDYFYQNFHLADDIERLPGSRLKLALGARLNFYANERISVRTYYRYYTDDWGITSNTASIEVPIKISDKFTIYPSYRFYKQTAADYFKPYNMHLSTAEYYTSDYDLSKFQANNYGFGISYTDIFTNFHIRKWGLKSIDFKYNNYSRNTGLDASIFSFGLKFVAD